MSSFIFKFMITSYQLIMDIVTLELILQGVCSEFLRIVDSCHLCDAFCQPRGEYDIFLSLHYFCMLRYCRPPFRPATAAVSDASLQMTSYSKLYMTRPSTTPPRVSA